VSIVFIFEGGGHDRGAPKIEAKKYDGTLRG
jgi:hypothetical protein